MLKGQFISFDWLLDRLNYREAMEKHLPGSFIQWTLDWKAASCSALRHLVVLLWASCITFLCLGFFHLWVGVKRILTILILGYWFKKEDIVLNFGNVPISSLWNTGYHFHSSSEYSFSTYDTWYHTGTFLSKWKLVSQRISHVQKMLCEHLCP